MALRLESIPSENQNAVRAHVATRMETMRAYRLSWWAHWALLAEQFLPRRYRWFVTPNTYNRGSPMNQSIVDETGVLAARVLATGLLSGLTSPTKPWFAVALDGIDVPEGGEVARWLAEVTKRMLSVFAGSNFYEMWGQALWDLVVFGSAALIEYEDTRNVIHFYNPCLGEFFFGLSKTLRVDTLYREYTYTIKDAVDEFGLENVSESTRTAYKTAANLDTEVVICHAIEPNGPIYSGGQQIPSPVPQRFKFREVYWEQTSQAGQKAGYITRMSGFMEKPHIGFRWDVTSNDAYGRSPGMDALPASRQLQLEQRRKAEGIDKMVRPPMVAHVSMRNEPMDTLPGGVTFSADPAGSMFKPAYQVEPRISEMTEDIKEVQARMQRVFFNDLFLGISQLGTVRSATEIEARQQETLVQIGPVIERTEGALDEVIERTFAICSRRGLFPPAPQEIQGLPLSIKYVSMFAEVQRAAATASIERLMAFAGGLVGVKPDIMDNIDTDEVVQEYAEALNVPPKVIRATAEVIQLRAQRSQEQQMATGLQTGLGLAQGAKTLSDTDVGGGVNALQAITGGGQGAAPRAA